MGTSTFNFLFNMSLAYLTFQKINKSIRHTIQLKIKLYLEKILKFVMVTKSVLNSYSNVKYSNKLIN